jgi:hypothetical protein
VNLVAASWAVDPYWSRQLQVMDSVCVVPENDITVSGRCAPLQTDMMIIRMI